MPVVEGLGVIFTGSGKLYKRTCYYLAMPFTLKAVYELVAGVHLRRGHSLPHKTLNRPVGALDPHHFMHT